VKILALDTSTEHCSVALLDEGRVLAVDAPAGQKHSEVLLPMVDGLLEDAGLRLEDLAGIAFGAGPGSFTGLRIACAVAQGLAFGVGKKVVPISTLLAMAAGSGAARVVAALDARMNEVYLAAYVRDGDGWRTIIRPSLQAPDVPLELPGAGWIGVGSGFAVCDGALAAACGHRLGQIDVLRKPHAADMARLAAPLLAAGLGVAPEEAAPFYVRDKVALKVSER
jgi:tRNA threonylcarbamoyladenosine biosynthesis protein TsaB